MKNKIKEVQDYFKSKLFAQDFKIEKVSEYQIEISIDLEYKFIIWTGNQDIPRSRKNYDGALSFMDLQLNVHESEKLHGILSPVVKKYRAEVLLNQKKLELEKLQREIDCTTI